MKVALLEVGITISIFTDELLMAQKVWEPCPGRTVSRKVDLNPIFHFSTLSLLKKQVLGVCVSTAGLRGSTQSHLAVRPREGASPEQGSPCGPGQVSA